MAGWVKLHRQLLNWEWFDDHNTFRLFIYCLLRANHTDSKWRGQDIKRGEFITSLDTLSRETGLSNSQIRTSLAKLKSSGEIASLAQARSRIITVVKYDSYQSNDKVIAGFSQADDRLIATDKNVKKEKKINTASEAPDSCPHQLIIGSYHQHLPTLRKVKVWGDARKKLLRSRWKESGKHQTIDFWDGLFSHIAESAFLMDDEKNNFLDLEWILKPANFIKIVEGKYHA